MTRVLAIDPGLHATGIVLLSDGTLQRHTTIRTTARERLTRRLTRISGGVTAFADTLDHPPGLIVVEYPLFPVRRVNWRGVSLLHQCVGAIVTAVGSTFPHVPVLFVVPARGRSRPATKTKVEGLTSHEADAYCLAEYVIRARSATIQAIDSRCHGWREAVVCYSRGRVEVTDAWR